MRKIRNVKDIGYLDKKILIQKEVTQSDGGAGRFSSWVDMFGPGVTKWAKINSSQAQRLSQWANLQIFQNVVVFEIQHNKEVAKIPTGKMRIVYPAAGENKKAYRVEGINRTGENSHFLEIAATGNEIDAV